MTPTRLRQCLDVLGWSQSELGPRLGATPRLSRAWAAGTVAIPPMVEAWLEASAANRARHPDPPPPLQWRIKREWMQAHPTEDRE